VHGGRSAIGTAFFAKTNIQSFKEFTHFVNVQVVSPNAFMNSTLEEIEFPNVTNIAYNAFRGSHVVEATIPATVTQLGEHCFNCTTMTRLTILPTTPPTLYLPLSNATALFYVPASSLEAYKSADKWSTLASRIYAIPD